MTPGQGFVELDRGIHDRRSFDCGRNELNEFLRKNAVSNREQRVSTTMVLPALEPEPSGLLPITTYYTTTTKEITREDLPENQRRRLPRYPLPIFYIACVAVQTDLQKQGLGKRALISALQNFHLAVINGAAGVGVLIDPIDSDVSNYYKNFGFEPLNAIDDRLFMSIGTVEQLFS